MLTPGMRLGPYEIVSALGAGGMGEVYKARDTRLGREVAVKVLPAEFAQDAERLRRFEQEARAAAVLNHPNILVLCDIGSGIASLRGTAGQARPEEARSGDGGEAIPSSTPGLPRPLRGLAVTEEAREEVHYIVTELLDGESLRQRLRGGPLPPAKAVEFGIQIAQGLAAAHEKGIVHRDLKPGNLFVTKEGRVKILDFGLARLRLQEGPLDEARSEAVTADSPTREGKVLGTPGYMAPEQVRGRSVDARTDLFALGVVLYEMLSGKQPFQKETAPETMTAILREEPPELSGTGRAISPGLERVVRRCMEKEPGTRFQSASDLAFALEAASSASNTGAVQAPSGLKRKSGVRAFKPLAVAGATSALLVLVGVAATLYLDRLPHQPSQPSFKRITLRRGEIHSARFTPDLQSVVYSASWGGKPSEIFVQRLASADARSLGVTNADVVGTVGGEVAILRDDGTLERLPLEGGTPREIAKGVLDATWDRRGAGFAIVRKVGDRYRLEFPPGKVLFEAKGLEGIVGPSLSPDGTRVAYVFKPYLGDLSGDLCVAEPSGQSRTLSRGWRLIGGLAWSADGKEIWFTATRSGFNQELHAVTLSGEERLAARLPGNLVLHDTAPDGRLLATFGQARRTLLRGRMAGDAAERDLSWLDGTMVPTLSPDGTQMVFQEFGEGGGPDASVYHWRMDGSVPKRLGEGTPWDVSPDWTTVLVGVVVGEKLEARLMPIGAGESTTLPRGPMQNYMWGQFCPDGKRVLLVGSNAQGEIMLFVQSLDGSLPRPIAKTVYAGLVSHASPDGKVVPLKKTTGGPWVLQPIEGGEAHPIPFLKPGDLPLSFTEDGHSLLVSDTSSLYGRFPVHIASLDLRSGARQPWLELAPPDWAGVRGTLGFQITPDGRFYSYGYIQALSDLYLIEGLK